MGERWWGEDELPPPSMRHTYSPSQRPFRTKLPHRVSPQPPPYSAVCGSDDRDIEKRLNDLKSERAVLENKGESAHIFLALVVLVFNHIFLMPKKN